MQGLAAGDHCDRPERIGVEGGEDRRGEIEVVDARLDQEVLQGRAGDGVVVGDHQCAAVGVGTEHGEDRGVERGRDRLQYTVPGGRSPSRRACTSTSAVSPRCGTATPFGGVPVVPEV